MNFLIMTLLNGFTIFVNPDNVVTMIQGQQSCLVEIDRNGEFQSFPVKEKCINIVGQGV